MPSWLECDEGHGSNTLLYDAAIALSKSRPPRCRRCGKPFHYYVEHRYANVKGEKNCYEAIQIVRINMRPRMDRFDPFLLRLQHCDDPKNIKLLPIFWAPDKTGRIRVGQFPPLLSPQDWKNAFRKLKIEISTLN